MYEVLHLDGNFSFDAWQPFVGSGLQIHKLIW